MCQPGALITLHRYFIWANKMREEFDELIRERGVPDAVGDGIEHMMYMSYWYAGTYVVVEGYEELDLSNERIDSLLQSDMLDRLRRFRNGVYHFQPDYFDARQQELLTEKDSTPWLRELTAEFGRFFLQRLRDEREECN